MSMIVRTPLPSSPTSQATVSSNSGSLDALERLPSLSLSRWMRKVLRLPSGSTRGTRKHDRPPGDWARTRKRSFIGALVNHLCPRSRQVPSVCSTAAVVLARTSVPPCFSVIPIPASRPRLAVGVLSPGSYTRPVSSGSYVFARSGERRSAGTTAYVIETGHRCPCSSIVASMKPPARATWAPGRSSAQAAPASPAPTEASISA
ncbi:hypothetical protein SBADM41S_06782 [Streptomyces badius]